MDDIKKQKKISVGFWVFFLAVCGFVLAAWRYGNTEPAFNEEKVYELDTAWHGEEQPQEVDSLPAFFSVMKMGRPAFPRPFPKNGWNGEIRSVSGPRRKRCGSG